MIPREDIDAVRAAADIEAVVRDYGVELKNVGNRLVGLCPSHNERTPSFNVNIATQTFHCFGCQIGGDVFAFFDKVDGMPFIDTVRMLADRYGIILHETQSDKDQEKASLRKRAFVAVAEAATWMRANFNALSTSHPAKIELIKRNLYEVEGRPDWLEEFGIGYAREGWSHLSEHLLSKSFTEEEIIAAGLATKSEKTGKLVDRFRGRLTWEIRDLQGRVVGFGARKLFDSDDGPKYLNSPQSIIYDKSRLIYGLDIARKAIVEKNEVHIVEGYTDVMANHAVGIINVGASSGTAFGEEHVAVLRRLLDDYDGRNQGRFVFAFDTDAAGQQAARRTFALKAPIHTRSYVAGNNMPAKDSCDLRLQDGDEALRTFMQSRTPLTDFVLREELKNHDITLAEGRSSFVRVAASMLSVITDNMLREDYARRVSFMSGSNYDAVAAAISAAPRFDPEAQDTTQVRTSTPTSDEPPYPDGIPPEDDPFASETVNSRTSLWDQEFSLLAILLQYPQIAWSAIEEHNLSEADFPDEELRMIFTEANLMVESNIKMVPSDFTYPDTVLLLVHHRMNMLERFLNTPRAEELISRTAQRFARSLKEAPLAQRRKSLSRQVEESFSDRNTEDITALQEILDQQKKIKRVRRNS